MNDTAIPTVEMSSVVLGPSEITERYTVLITWDDGRLTKHDVDDYELLTDETPSQGNRILIINPEKVRCIEVIDRHA